MVNRPTTVLILALPGDEAHLDHYVAYLSERTVTDDRRLCTVGYRPAVTEGWRQAGWRLLPIDAAEDGALAAAVSACYSHTHDLIVIRVGTLVPEQWDLRLAALVPTDALNLALSPLGTKPPVFSAFLPEARARDLMLDVDQINDWLAVQSAGRLFDVPSLSGSCNLFRGSVWADLSKLSNGDHDRDWLSAGLQRGALLLGTDGLYCDDRGQAGPVIESPRYHAEVEGFESRHVLTGLRHALTDLATRGERPLSVPAPKPVQLHVSHCWGGGLGRWVEDFVDADSQRHNLVLRSIGVIGTSAQRLSLYRTAAMDVPIRSWVLATPILATSIRHREYQAVLAEIVRDFGVEAIVVSSFIGQSLDILRTGLPTIVSVHDFYPYCPALVATFDTPCLSCDGARLAQCHAENPENRFFDTVDSDYQQALRAQYLADIRAAGAHLVFPTRQLRTQLVSLAPDLADCPFSVIGHGLGGRLIEQLVGLRTQLSPGVSGDRLRLVVLGSLTPHKGRALFDAVVDTLAATTDIYLLGCGDDGQPYRNRSHVTVIPRYERSELADRLGEIDPDLGLLLSVVPETFSYTLSELQTAGIPVLATRLGAFAERITPEVDGFLVEPDAASLCASIESLSRDRHRLAQVAANLCRQPQADAATMVAGYAALLPLPAINASRWRHRRALLGSCISDRHQRVGSVLYIDAQAKFRDVLVDFLHYAASKLGGTDRLPAGVRQPMGGSLRWLAQRLRRR